MQIDMAYGRKKELIESALKIDLAGLKSMGLLTSGQGLRSGTISWTFRDQPYFDVMVGTDMTRERPHLLLAYDLRSSSGPVKMDNALPLVKDPRNYGGFRWLVVCRCGKRVRSLYLGASGFFECRECADLIYLKNTYSGRWRGFVTAPELEKQRAKVKRMVYRGKPTKKYLKYLKMREQYYRIYGGNLKRLLDSTGKESAKIERFLETI